MRNQRFKHSDADFASYTSQRYNKEIESGRLSPKDAALIKEFLNDQTGKLSPTREYTLLGMLITSKRYFAEYYGISTGEVQEGIKSILTEADDTGKPRYAQNTKATMIKLLKRFFLWMCDNGYGENLNEKKLHKISPPAMNLMTKTADSILTKEEIEKIIKAAMNSRDRAMVAVLYEAGLRARELAELTWKDIKFNAHTVVINTAGKTGKPRYIPCVLCRQYISAWKNDYPGEPLPDSYVFVTLSRSRKDVDNHAPLTYAGLKAQLNIMLKRAGIERHITPHCFRHSRVTHLIQDEMPETYIKKMMWGSVSTDMFQTYAHIVNDDLDRGIAEIYGIDVADQAEKKKSRAMKPRQCPLCGYVNAPTANYCVCGAPLTEEARQQSSMNKDELMALVTDPRFLVEFVSVMQEQMRLQGKMKKEDIPIALSQAVHVPE